MARGHAALLAFNRGEVSRLAMARVDVAKLQLAAECQLNWEPKVMGPMSLRPGLQYVGEIYNDAACVLKKFVFGKGDTSLLEFTDTKLRIWINDVLLARVAVSTVISDPNFAGGGTWSTAGTTSGATTTIAGGVLTLAATPLGSLSRAKQTITVAVGDRGKEHGLRLAVANGPVTVRIGTTDGLSDVLAQSALDTGTHSLSFTPAVGTIYLQIDSTDQRAKTLTQCTIEAAGTVTLPTPWSASYLPLLRTTQSGDIVYVAAYQHQQYKIERRGTRPAARGWSVVAYRSGDGPFHAGADAALTLTPSTYVGNATIAASRPFFSVDHIGALLRLFCPGQTNYQVLGAANTFSPATRVTGIGTDRIIGVNVGGAWTGTISLQRSLIGPDQGFVTIGAADTGWASPPTLTGNFAINFNDNASGSPATRYDNVIAWYRIGFETGNYASGSATVFTNYNAGGRFGLARITGYGSATLVGVEILDSFSSITATADWQISDWCAAFAWPSAGAFHEGRLWWLSGGTIPIAGSQSDDFTGFAEEDSFGDALGDAGAVLEGFGEGPSDLVNWALPLTRLLCGRETSIASIRSSSFDEPLTPTNFSVKDCATQGARRLPAVKIDKRGVFVEQSGRRVYGLEFNPQAMDYSPFDMTRLNLDAGNAGFTDIDVARQLDTAIYLPRGDGQCAVMLDEPNDEVSAWWRIQTLGVIENVCVLPANTGAEDQVYFVVKRTINGVTRRFLEKLASRDACVGGLINKLVDCHLSYSGAAVATITLAHLPSTSVQLWADGLALGAVTTDGAGVATLPGGATAQNIVAGLGGATISYASDTPATSLTGLAAYNGYPAEVFADEQPSGRMIRLGTFTVTAGAIALPANMRSCSIIAFLGYMAPFRSAKLGLQGGEPLTGTKKLDHLGLVLMDAHSQGLQYGQRFDKLDDMPLTEDGATVTAGTVWSEYDEPMSELAGEWDTDARLCLLGQSPYPMKVCAAVVAIS